MLRSMLDLPGRAQWSQRYRELVAYREQNGHCCVPKAQGSLGRWVARQRELRRKRQLYSEREAKLDALGFVWNTNDHAWDAKFTQLLEWQAHHGHACVPIAEGELGVWVAKQRQLKRKHKLQRDREARLDSLDFVWDTPNTDWNEKFEALERWKTVCGDCRVPFNEGELGWWVNTQRQRKRKGKLTKEREDRLNAIGFIWNPQGAPPPSEPPTPGAATSGAGPSNLPPRTRSGSDGSAAGSVRRRKRRISDDRSSQDSKRHHSDLSESSAPSYSFLQRHGYSTSSQSSFDSFRDSDVSNSLHPQFQVRGATSPSSNASATDLDENILPPVSSVATEADSGNANTLAPLQNVPGDGASAPFASHVLPSLVRAQSASAQSASFTASTDAYARRSFVHNRRIISTVEQLPSVHTLRAPPPPPTPSQPSPFMQATSARSLTGVAPASPWPGQWPLRSVPSSATMSSSSASSKTAVSSLLAPMPEASASEASRRSNLRQLSLGGVNNSGRSPLGQPFASSSGGLFDTGRPSQGARGSMFQFGSGWQRGRGGIG